MPSEEGTTDVTTDELGPLRQRLHELETEYSKARRNFYYKSRSYYSQSIGSNYIKEEDILKLLDECRSIKEEYNRIKKHLLDGRVKPERWTFRSNFIYNSQIYGRGENNG